MPKVLVVEDDDSMAVALKDGFAYEGFQVTLARDGAEGLALARAGKVDLMILDVMLPKMNGLDVCRELRKEGNQVPIIMLTARGQEIDKVLGLKLGADDYVTKPFGFLELMARVEALRAERAEVDAEAAVLSETLPGLSVEVRALAETSGVDAYRKRRTTELAEGEAKLTRSSEWPR